MIVVLRATIVEGDLAMPEEEEDAVDMGGTVLLKTFGMQEEALVSVVLYKPYIVVL